MEFSLYWFIIGIVVATVFFYALSTYKAYNKKKEAEKDVKKAEENVYKFIEALKKGKEDMERIVREDSK